jgi:hypothetical protein
VPAAVSAAAPGAARGGAIAAATAAVPAVGVALPCEQPPPQHAQQIVAAPLRMQPPVGAGAPLNPADVQREAMRAAALLGVPIADGTPADPNQRNPATWGGPKPLTIDDLDAPDGGVAPTAAGAECANLPALKHARNSSRNHAPLASSRGVDAAVRVAEAGAAGAGLPGQPGGGLIDDGAVGIDSVGSGSRPRKARHISTASAVSQ